MSKTTNHTLSIQEIESLNAKTYKFLSLLDFDEYNNASTICEFYIVINDQVKQKYGHTISKCETLGLDVFMIDYKYLLFVDGRIERYSDSKFYFPTGTFLVEYPDEIIENFQKINKKIYQKILLFFEKYGTKIFVTVFSIKENFADEFDDEMVVKHNCSVEKIHYSNNIEFVCLKNDFNKLIFLFPEGNLVFV